MSREFTIAEGPVRDDYKGSEHDLPVRKKVIVVLGMHRSGTSALTGTLCRLGVGLGRSLMPPDEKFNPKGFWENEKIVSIHERLLEAFGCEWHDPRLLPEGWLSRRETVLAKREISEVIAEEFRDYSVWGVKDPRLCRLLPLWKEVFSDLGINPVYVHIFRNPLEVAMSLARRDGLSIENGLLLWCLYHFESLRHTRGESQAFIEYYRLIGDWRGSIDRVAKTLCVRWSKSIETAADEIDRFLSAECYHHKCESGSLSANAGISRFVSTLFELLRKCSGEGAADCTKEIAQYSMEFEEILKLFKPWQSNFDKALLLRVAQLQELTMELENARQTVQQQGQQIQGFDAGLKEAQQLVDERNRSITRLDIALKQAQRLVREKNRSIDRLDAALQEAQQLVDERNRSIARLDSALKEAQRWVEDRNALIDRLEPALEEAQVIVKLQNEKLAKTDAGLQEAQSIVAERNRYVDVLEPALREAQGVVDQQNDQIKRIYEHPLLRHFLKPS